MSGVEPPTRALRTARLHTYIWEFRRYSGTSQRRHLPVDEATNTYGRLSSNEIQMLYVCACIFICIYLL